jgi:cyclopropane-fatty-acyl-phospholipid synthase
MIQNIVPAEVITDRSREPKLFIKWARSMVLSQLSGLQYGRLTLIDGKQRFNFGQRSPDFPLAATIRVHHPVFYRKLLLGGTVGAGEAYMSGDWDTDDLVMVIRMMVLNQSPRRRLDEGLWRVGRTLHWYFHNLNRNTLRGSRRNIMAHYDLGNDFYALFLDPTMTYSCGIFKQDDSSLMSASIAKYDRICQKLQLKPSDHVVEIGSGWGGFALYAAEVYGCRVTTITISDAQYRYARRKIKSSPMADRIQILRRDYRHMKGKFDKLVSIEMIEAVGHQYYPVFFATCSQLLKDSGMMLIQAITIADNAFNQHKKSVDFIKRYIFPGCCIPSQTALSQAAATTDLRLFHLEDITPHYAKTLRAWRERFLANLDKIKAMGLGNRFIRMWIFYLCYCEGGFEERYLGDIQLLFTKPFCRRSQLLPDLQA